MTVRGRAGISLFLFPYLKVFLQGPHLVSVFGGGHEVEV